MERTGKVLLLGGSGLLSGAALAAFLAEGREVCVLTRGESPLPVHPRLAALKGDRHDAASLASALKGRRFDFTADFLAYGAADLERLLAVPGFSPGRLVMISTGQVYLVTRDQRPPFREEAAAAPVIPEPVKDTRDWHNWVYGMGKRAAEEALLRLGRQRGLETLALRLPVVQGETDWRNSRRLWAWLERMKDGWPVLLPDGGVNPVRFVYAGDAAAALVKLADIPAWPSAPALNLAQAGEMPLKDFLELAAACAGLKPRFVPVTEAELAGAGLDGSIAPYWGRWCSRPDPSAAFALGLTARGPQYYLGRVVAAHMGAAAPLSHEGYARRPEEVALAARLAGRR